MLDSLAGGFNGALAAVLAPDWMNKWHEWGEAEKHALQQDLTVLLAWAQRPEATPADMVRVWRILQNSSMIFVRSSSEWNITAEYEALEAVVAANPATPLHILAWTVWSQPEALASNPIAPLLPLEAPDFFVRYKVSERAISSLVRCGHLPASLAALIASGAGGAATPPIVEDARMHISLAGEASEEEWQEELRAFWRAHVAAVARGKTRKDQRRRSVYKDLVGLGLLPESYGIRGGNLRNRLHRAADPATPESKREAMYEKDRSIMVRCATLLNPATSEERFAAVMDLRQSEDKKKQSDASALQRVMLWRRRRPSTIAGVIDYCTDIMYERAWSAKTEVEFPLALCLGIARSSPAIGWKDFKITSESCLWWLRLAGMVGMRPTHPPVVPILRKLKQDGNRLVRAAAHTCSNNPDFVFRL